MVLDDLSLILFRSEGFCLFRGKKCFNSVIDRKIIIVTPYFEVTENWEIPQNGFYALLSTESLILMTISCSFSGSQAPCSFAQHRQEQSELPAKLIHGGKCSALPCLKSVTRWKQQFWARLPNLLFILGPRNTLSLFTGLFTALGSLAKHCIGRRWKTKMWNWDQLTIHWGRIPVKMKSIIYIVFWSQTSCFCLINISSLALLLEKTDLCLAQTLKSRHSKEECTNLAAMYPALLLSTPPKHSTKIWQY